MEADEFYDIRGPEKASGVFDLRSRPPAIRAALIKVARNRCLQGAPEIQLDEYGFAHCVEPQGGPNLPWTQRVFEVQQQMEIALNEPLPMLTRVERVYAIHFPGFQPQDWKTLAELFAQMPGWIEARPRPHWFGRPNGAPPFLFALIEEGGLRARGLLPQRDWLAWDMYLRKNMYRVPTRPPGAI